MTDKEILNLAQAELVAMYKRLGIKGSNVLTLIDEALRQPPVSGLLPCPFCGKSAYEGKSGDGQFTIKCYDCGMVMTHDRKDKVNGHWNQRQ